MENLIKIPQCDFRIRNYFEQGRNQENMMYSIVGDI